jgi:glycosyltransferase involved in cell wall biosynthesis
MKKINVMLVTHEPPCLGYGGSGNYLDLMVKYFLKRGHKVSIFLSDWGFLNNKIQKNSYDQLKKKGVIIRVINFQKENLFNKFKKILQILLYPEKIYFKQSKLLSDELEIFCKKINPNILFLYCGQSLQWASKIKNIKKFCPLVELPYLNARYWFSFALNKKFFYDTFKQRLFSLINLYISFFAQKKLINLFKKIDFPAHVSYDYFHFFKKNGVKNIKYYNHPIEDLKKEYLRMRNSSFKKYEKKKI